MLAADYPFLNILWTMIIFFAWVAWIWMIVIIFSDIFRREDIGGTREIDIRDRHRPEVLDARARSLQGNEHEARAVEHDGVVGDCRGRHEARLAVPSRVERKSDQAIAGCHPRGFGVESPYL